MQINDFNHTERLDEKKIRFIDVLSFFMGFASAMLAYVVSTYFSRAIGSDNIGIFYLIAYAIILAILLNLHKLVNISGKSFVFHLAFIIKIIAIVFLIMMPISMASAILLVAYIIAEAVSWVALDVILEAFSKDSESGRIRGSHLAIMNTGFIVGPLLSSQILERYDFAGIFVVVLVIHALIFSTALFGLRGTGYKFKKSISVKNLIKDVVRRKNVIRIYYISFVLEAFYALMVAYVPIYLLGKGFSWEQLGIAFTIMLIPFIVVQYPMGILADRRTGEKEFLILAIAIMGVSSLAFFLLDSYEIMTWTIILFATRVGAALIEVLRESYFYKRIDASDVDVINFFKTSKPVAYIVTMFLATVVIYFFSIKAVFLLVAIIAFSALYPAFMLVDNKSKAEIMS
ncbi:MAG: MFS transporter [Candidatus Moranbacteria bacterium]|nr:MFS transporter [Candidatus Moranbacteria bacterium]